MDASPQSAAAASVDVKKLLNTPVEQFGAIGQGRARLLQKLEIRSVSDLLFHFPRDYQDLSDERLIADLEEDKLQSVRGIVAEVDAQSRGFGKSRVALVLTDSSGALRATWFNQPFMRSKFSSGQRLLLTAKPRLRGLMWEMSHPQFTPLGDDEEAPEQPSMLALYPLTEGLSQFHLRRMIGAALDEYGDKLQEVFSPRLLAEYDLMPLVEALRAIHVPEDEEQRDRARRRFVFQELFILQLGLSIRRGQQRDLQAPSLPASAKIDARIRRLLPFELTKSQNESIHQISADMALDRPMNRILQGDVGSGKTIVALYAMLVCVAHGSQAALMAPTEILARQHAQTLAKLLEASRVRYAVLTGGMAKSERDQLLADIAAGKIDVLLGTQAILQEDVQFLDLGLIIIDEQHKFGVRQRAALRQDDNSPHYLVMTATPIPRTLTMTLFGDLDLSTLRELPSGRQPVNTYLVEPGDQPQWWQFVRDRLREGRQAYVVAPLVDESENVSAPSVSDAFEQLTNGELEAFRLSILHGRMSSAEKGHTMDEFREGETQVLVSTSVIEVGVDVANATVMTIAGADRFGLAQLHQLRGRVGRGGHAGFCGVLLGDSSDSSDGSRERLEAFAASTDGFKLAELDFKLRGPGDLFGTQQHGLPPLRIADLQRDRDTLEEARREAQLLVATDPGLRHADHTKLRRQMLARYGKALDLGDVG